MGNINVGGLLSVEFSELGIESGQVELGDLLVKFLGEDVDHSLLVFILAVLVLPELELSQDLVGEGARHDEGWVTGSTT